MKRCRFTEELIGILKQQEAGVLGPTGRRTRQSQSRDPSGYRHSEVALVKEAHEMRSASVVFDRLVVAG